jgi:hypothetical protein
MNTTPKAPDVGDGGSLYPLAWTDRHGDTHMEYGASLRDYFAAHAPDFPPTWFTVEMEDPMPRVLDKREALAVQLGFADLSEEEKNEALEWLGDGIYDIKSEPVRAVAEAASDLIKASELMVQAWNERHNEARYFAWRWYYAQQMLAHRP